MMKYLYMQTLGPLDNYLSILSIYIIDNVLLSMVYTPSTFYMKSAAYRSIVPVNSERRER